MSWQRVGLLVVLLASSFAFAVWGFYAHREINRLAVYTLPDRLAGFYKDNITFVSAHAVDPDKRRYAASLEGPRHYIDLERFGGSMNALPTEFPAFHRQFTTLYCVNGQDSTELVYRNGHLVAGRDSAAMRSYEFDKWYRDQVFPAYRRELVKLDYVPPTEAAPGCERLGLVDTMMEHGVLPYHLVDMQRWLTIAFRQNQLDRALQLSAEIGHYIGDATVPLHTTVNYNGQLTGQRGIHAFWESRIPELFAEEEFDVLVGAASYIEDKPAFYRGLVRTSHEHVDSVLLIEADLRAKLPEEVQDCYEERLGRVVRVPCRQFARAYYERLDGMVEARFRTAIRAVGSAWLTAWIDAGRPTLGGDYTALLEPADTIVRRPHLDGREH